MLYIIIEILIFSAWIYLIMFKKEKNHTTVMEKFIILIFAIPATIIMEIINEVIFKNEGAYYPASLFYFPGYKFPTAIILAGGIFSWFIYSLSGKMANRILKTNGIHYNIIHVLCFLLFLSICGLVEMAGITVKYWQYYQQPIMDRYLYLGVYVFYFAFAFPGFFAAKIHTIISE
jgi:hypothetical protein